MHMALHRESRTLPSAPRGHRMRGVFKWIGIVAAALVLLAMVFHRPILFRLTRYFVVRAAEQQNLAIDYKIAGSIFTNLRITDLKATPTEPGPVERLEIGSLQLEYSLWGLLQIGLPGFLESAALKDVFITIDPAKRPAPDQKQKPSTKFPALIPKKLTVENLNFTSRRRGDDLTISGFDLLVDPQSEGWLRAQTIQLPGIHTWSDVSAAATYANRNLIIKKLDLGPELQVRELSLDMSKLSNDVLEFSVDATLFGGPATVSGKITDLNEANVLTLSAISKDNSLAQASSYIGTAPPLDGMLRELRVDFTGAIAKPVTWSGGATIRVENFEGVAIAAPTDAKVVVTVADGKAIVQSVELLQAENNASATATIDLPRTLEGFANLNAIGTVTGDLNEVGAVSGGTVKGSVEVQGNFTIKEGDLVADVSAQTDGLTARDGEIGKADVRIQLKKALPQKTAPIWKGLETTITGKAGKVRFRDYEADSAEFNLTSRDDRVQVKDLTVGSAENKLGLSGEFVLPEDPARFDQNLLALDINLDAPDLKQLIAAKTGKQLNGDLSVSGKLTRKDGALNGSLSLSGSELESSTVSWSWSNSRSPCRKTGRSPHLAAMI
jgi:hypothetical protein